MITHDLSNRCARRGSDRRDVSRPNRAGGETQEVVGNPQHPYTKALLSVAPRRDPRDRTKPQILSGETPDARRIPSGCRFYPRCPIAIADCKLARAAAQST